MNKIIIFVLILLISCNEEVKIENSNQNKEFTEWIDSVWLAKVNRFPALQTEYGFHTNDDKWDNISDSMKLAELDVLTKNISEISNRFDVNNLSGQALLSYKIYLYNVETELAGKDYIYNEYPVSQMYGWHTQIASTLINQHTINSKQDAENYITRVKKVPEVISQLIKNLKVRKEMGIVAPKIILDYVISSSKNLIVQNTNEIENNPIYIDFIEKTNKLEMSLENEIRTAILENFSPAYQSLVSYLNELKNSSKEDIGAWSMKNGIDYYNYQLKLNNTIDITPNEIYEFGVSEVKRIHNEMINIKEEVGFKGDLKDFFIFMRDDNQFYYPNTQEGKKQYLDKAINIIETMKGELSSLFNTLPKTDIVVKAVEPYREQSAGKAFYETPSIDGKRPGMYYANLYDMTEMPIYQMEALAYHEGIPGHHMQIALSQELEGIPQFRKVGNLYVSYVEGWGLYSELLPKEIGFYKDPYSDFGRLAMELWRACRLVVDVGIHSKEWNRQKAINYYNENTPASNGESIGMVDRHIVLPGQATGYKIGMRHILQLRKKAKQALNNKFDIKKFHDLVLEDGPVPLFILSENVNRWIEKNKINNKNDESEINEVETKVITDPSLGM